MDLSTASDDVLEVLAFAAIVRHPLGPLAGAVVLAAGAEQNLPEHEAARWDRAIERALASFREAKHDTMRTSRGA
jgi:hypothetical protein